MSDYTPLEERGEEGTDAADSAAGAAGAAVQLASLLRDLETLRAYLDDRGRHTYELAQRFLANAARDPGARAYDERQATMLEYQHYIWHEIAGRIAQLLVAYGTTGGAGGASDDEAGAEASDAKSDADEANEENEAAE
jgi:hypothetical protein